MIRRVRIQGYKSLKDVEIELKPLTVVFGPNAAGKSNLFDALALISRIVTEKNLAEAFKDHRGTAVEAFYYGDEGWEALRTKGTASFAIQVDVDLSDHVMESVEKRIRQLRERFRVSEEGEKPKRRVTKTSLRYEIGVEIAPSSGYLQVLNERLSALKKDRSEAKVPLPFIYKDEAGRKLRLRLEGQASRPTEHDIGLDYALISTPLYAPHYPHATAFKEEVSQWRFYYLEPDAMRQPTTAQPLARLGRSGANLAAFYNYLKSRDPRHFDTVSHALHELVPGIDTLSVKPTGDGRLQLWVEEEGVEFSAGVISEGTLRVLGLLAITNPIEPVTVIGYEEPENGVHPRRLKLIADLLKNAAAYGRQIIVNTHSPIFPEYFDNDASLSVAKSDMIRSSKGLPPMGLYFVPRKFEKPLTKLLSLSEFCEGILVASISIGYFVEDLAHSSFLKSLVVRVASDRGLDATTLVHDLRNASGGASRALGELKQFARDVRRERESPFDILIAAIDTNCRRAHSVKRHILDTLILAGYPGIAVCATPNPHIERWYLADPRGFRSALGSTTIPQLPRYKCERDYYKHALRNALMSAGITPVLGGTEFGPDIVADMDLYRAARRDASLKHFINDLRQAFTPYLRDLD